jgi:DNA-binding transcriptional MerR regulator
MSSYVGILHSMKTSTRKQVYNTSEAAAIIGVTPRRVRALCETGQLRATLLTRRLYMIAHADLESLLRDRRRKGL